MELFESNWKHFCVKLIEPAVQLCVCVCVCVFAVWSRTLGVLWEDELPDELVCGLRVQRQGVAQRLQVWTLFQEGFLQAHATGVEVLLREQMRRDMCL